MSETIVRDIVQEIGLRGPLSLEINEGGKEEIAFVDEDEYYGVIDGDYIQMHNMPEPGSNGPPGMKIKIDSIQEFRAGELGYCVVVFLDDSVNTYRCKARLAEVEEPLKSNYKHPTIALTKYILYKVYPDIENKVWTDVMTGSRMIDRSLIGESGVVPYQGESSHEVVQIALELSKEYNEISVRGTTEIVMFNVAFDHIDKLICDIAARHYRNPFLSTIIRVQWDGTHRLDSLLQTVGCHAPLDSKEEEAEYLSTVSRIIFLGAIQKSCESEYGAVQAVPVFVGPQGVGKSSIPMKLGLEWYGSTTKSFSDGQKICEAGVGTVLMELKEMSQIAKDSPEDVKAFIDTTEIQYRKPWAREPTKSKITFMCIGTTNDSTLSRDVTGNRRFFPVFMDYRKPEKAIVDFTRDEVLQLWAEA